MQKRIDRLNLYYKGRKYDCKIPCSLFSVLSERKVLPHPYKDFNEREYISAAENKFTVTTTSEATLIECLPSKQ